MQMDKENDTIYLISFNSILNIKIFLKMILDILVTQLALGQI